MKNSDDSPDPEDDRNGVEKALDNLSKEFGRIANGGLLPKPIAQSDFFRAVKDNKTGTVLKMLDQGIDPNVYNGSGQTALHVAAVNNAVETAQLLLERGADPLRGKKDKPDHTPLEDAVNFNKPEMAELLARHGGYMPGQMVNGWSLLHRACERNRPLIVEALLNAGANGNETTENGSTPLLIAVKLGYPELLETLMKFPVVLEGMEKFFVRTDDRKRTALHLAADRGHLPTITAMIKKGANVNSRDAEGKTPLFTAIDNGNIALVQLLVQAGADLNNPCGAYGTPLVYACETRILSNDKTRAAIIGCLIEGGADTDIASPATKMTSLHLVMNCGRTPEVLSALLRHPVDKNSPDAAGITPLLQAVTRSRSDYLLRLLEAGADPDGRHGGDACTPLILAAQNGSVSCVRILLEAGANPKLLDGHGKSALSYARSGTVPEIVEDLERALTEMHTGRKKPLTGQNFQL